MKLRFATAGIVASILFGAIGVQAQDSTFVALEGHVFDAKTLRPLQHAYLEYRVQLPSGPGGALAVVTDANGFYSFQFLPPFETPTTFEFFAVCQTKRGNVRVDGQLYYPLRTEVYRRDFYVTLPRGVTKCTP